MGAQNKRQLNRISGQITVSKIKSEFSYTLMFDANRAAPTCTTFHLFHIYAAFCFCVFEMLHVLFLAVQMCIFNLTNLIDVCDNGYSLTY